MFKIFPNLAILFVRCWYFQRYLYRTVSLCVLQYVSGK